MMHPKLVLWLVTAMLRWTLPEAQHEAHRARYEVIAENIVEVAFDSEEPPLFKGRDGRAKSAVTIAAVASLESFFSEHVERGEDGYRGHNAKSWCYMQVNVNGGRIAMRGPELAWVTSDKPGWSGPDLAGDQQKCFRAGLHILRESIRICGDLSLYTSGRCNKDEPYAKHRMARAQALFTKLPELGSGDNALARNP